ncbi:uncharacterized protein PRD47_016773 [Ara ararauna]
MHREEPRTPLGACLVPLGFSATRLAKLLLRDFVHEAITAQEGQRLQSQRMGSLEISVLEDISALQVQQPLLPAPVGNTVTQQVKTNASLALLASTAQMDCAAAVLLASIALRTLESAFIPVPLGPTTPTMDSARLRAVSTALQGCSVENGDYPLQVVRVGQDSSAQQEQVSQTLMEPQTRALVVHAPLATSAQLAQAYPSNALWALTLTGTWEKGGHCPVSHFCPEGSSFPLPCLAGTYNNLTRQAACFPCAAGYYCPENTTSYSANPCPAGFYCPKGTRFATEFPCPRGYYNPDPMTQSLDSCLPCPPGHYCGKENLTSASGMCDAGWFCISAAWTSRPFDLDNYTNANCLCPATATGGKCTAGFYCPKGSPEPLPCPPGFYCNASGLSVPSGECTTGFYCKAGATIPNPTDGVTGNICPGGTYCTAASAVPKLCPAGTFSSLQGRRMLSECQPCPSGFYCEEPGLAAPTGECWEGYYCDNQQGPVIDFTLYPCPRGFYCPAGTSSSTQYSCPAGTFGPSQNLKAITECQMCPPGKYCEFSGLAAPTGDCAEGFWCKSGARIRTPQDGESGLPCPPGHYCPEGAPLPLQCPPGTWAGGEGSRSLQECQPCPGGYYCNSSGQRAPSGPCSPGYYCISGAQSSAPTDGLSGAPCPINHFCPLGSSSPAPCPPGSYVPHTHGEVCHACPEGEYCASGEKSQPCPQGYFCPKGTALPFACPAGSYNPSPRQGSCLPCPKGFFCPPNSSSFMENECPAGYYCPPSTASATQFPCPKGTYNPQAGSSLKSHCTPCDPVPGVFSCPY